MIPGWLIWLGRPQDLLFHEKKIIHIFSQYFPSISQYFLVLSRVFPLYDSWLGIWANRKTYFSTQLSSAVYFPYIFLVFPSIFQYFLVLSQYFPRMIPGWGIWLGQPQDLLFHEEQTFFFVYFPVSPHRNQVNNNMCQVLAQYVKGETKS